MGSSATVNIGAEIQLGRMREISNCSHDWLFLLFLFFNIQILFASSIHFSQSETLGIYLIQISQGTVDLTSVPQTLWIKVLHYVFLHRYQHPSQAWHSQAVLECYPLSDPNSIISFFTMRYVMSLKNCFLKTHFSRDSSFDRDFYLLLASYFEVSLWRKVVIIKIEEGRLPSISWEMASDWWWRGLRFSQRGVLCLVHQTGNNLC